MTKQVPVDISAVVENRGNQRCHEVVPDLACKRLALVNICLYGARGGGDRSWVLIDTGIPGSAHFIERAAEQRFGRNARPLAIVLTHAHFDHAGTVDALSRRWTAPVFAHPLELEHLTGRAAYPRPDPAVGGGLMARLAPLYPRGPINLGGRVHALPENGDVPFMPGWRWVHTPGHCRGHISLFREADRLLIAGDAFITTNQESAYAVLTQEPELHGPPAYFTENWEEARVSVEKLAALNPEYVVTGHGQPMHGVLMQAALASLAANFKSLAVPKEGKYVDQPPRAANY